MTVIAFNRIKAALVAQRNLIARSPEAAKNLINDLGIRDILVELPPRKTTPVTSSPKKRVAKKAAQEI